MTYNARDLLGHFVKPRSAGGDMCEHACCRGRRQHPKGQAVLLPSKALRHASDDALLSRYSQHQGEGKRDQRIRAQVLHEMERHDNEAKARDNRAHARYARQLEQADAVEASIVAAEAATSGNLVNKKGRARGVNPRTLITGRAADFERYASDEAKEFYSTRHRPTAASFRGADTRYVPRATAPRRRRFGTVSHSQLVRR